MPVALYFDKNRRVQRLANYGIQDGKVFDWSAAPPRPADRSSTTSLTCSRFSARRSGSRTRDRLAPNRREPFRDSCDPARRPGSLWTELNHDIFVENCARAALVLVAPAFAQAPKKDVASPALQKEFDGFIEKFRAALKANDSAAVAGMTRLPFMQDASSPRGPIPRQDLSNRDSRRRIARVSSAPKPSTLATTRTTTTSSSSAASISSPSPRRLRGSFSRKSASTTDRATPVLPADAAPVVLIG